MRGKKIHIPNRWEGTLVLLAFVSEGIYLALESFSLSFYVCVGGVYTGEEVMGNLSNGTQIAVEVN